MSESLAEQHERELAEVQQNEVDEIAALKAENERLETIATVCAIEHNDLVAEVERLLQAGSAWIRERVRTSVATPARDVRRELAAHRELASCRKTLVQRNANPQMVAERALFALHGVASG